ncbi:hypothetical protein BNJ_00034 [Kaumoebavirus]|uniref:hypothetical protein n=1 Tax=Kaumoebavirus TaxID=1859492 RepID=UPI0009C37434|nr:hypothetical protein BNJ_00034 [Kaumoebavirus]ARA71877.1 hypothetical protein BNJ_00034 [Kaumoebavirus]
MSAEDLIIYVQSFFLIPATSKLYYYDRITKCRKLINYLGDSWAPWDIAVRYAFPDDLSIDMSAREANAAEFAEMRKTAVATFLKKPRPSSLDIILYIYFGTGDLTFVKLANGIHKTSASVELISTYKNILIELKKKYREYFPMYKGLDSAEFNPTSELTHDEKVLKKRNDRS